jgi:hypothetical protein
MCRTVCVGSDTRSKITAKVGVLDGSERFFDAVGRRVCLQIDGDRKFWTSPRQVDGTPIRDNTTQPRTLTPYLSSKAHCLKRLQHRILLDQRFSFGQ